MSKSDVAAVVNFYEKWKKDRADDVPDGTDPFELFCAEVLLRDYNLSDEEVLHGVVGKSQDGGCDGLFFLVGGKLVTDTSPILDVPGLSAHLIMIQAKTGNGFSYLQVDRFDALTDDILDLDRTPSGHRHTYHARMLSLIKLFKDTFRKLNAPRLVIDYFYVTLLDVEENDDCRKSANHIKTTTVPKHFSRVTVNDFHFVNAARLFNLLFERPKFSRDLQMNEYADCSEGFVGVAKLRDLYTFLKGEDGELIERIFDDNVRGFQLDTGVNESILRTLKSSADKVPEFWLLNNGITILSPRLGNL